MLIKPGLLFEQLECYFKMETAQTKKTKTPEDVFSGFGNTDHLFLFHLLTFYRNTWSKMLNNFFKVGERQVVLLCILWKTHIAILVSGCFGDLWLIYIKGCWYPDALTYCLWTFRLSCVFPMWALFTDASLDDATLCKMLPIGGENIFCILLITNHCAE